MKLQIYSDFLGALRGRNDLCRVALERLGDFASGEAYAIVAMSILMAATHLCR
jgi:hypothetical protein